MKDKTLANARHAWLLQTIKDLKLKAPVADIHRKTDLSMGSISSSINGTRTVTENIIERFCKGFKINFEKAKEQIQRMADNPISDISDKKNDDNQRVIGKEMLKNGLNSGNHSTSLSSPDRNDQQAVFIGSYNLDDETLTNKSGNEFIDLKTGHYIMLVPLVNEYAYAGYLLGYKDAEYMDTLPKIYIPVTELHKGVYRGFETRNDSMDDGSSQAIEHGDHVVGRLINRNLYRASKLHLKKYPDYIIVHKDGILVKRVINHNAETGDITIHSLNPDKSLYPDEVINLGDVLQLFNVVSVQKNRR